MNERNDTDDKAAWAICGMGDFGPVLAFFEAHKTADEHSPTGEGFYFSSWLKSAGIWEEHDGGLYWDYQQPEQLEEVIGECVPFFEPEYMQIPYADFEAICFDGDMAAEQQCAAELGILPPMYTQKTKLYDVVITETLKRTVQIRANSPDEAQARIETGWKSGKHVLGAKDVKEVHFSVSERERTFSRDDAR
jgi:hypothetical protein